MIDVFTFYQDDVQVVVDRRNLTVTRGSTSVAVPLETWDRLIDQMAAAEDEVGDTAATGMPADGER